MRPAIFVQKLTRHFACWIQAGSEAEEEEEDEEYVVNSDSMESDNEIEEDADDVYYDDDDVDADFGAQNITARRPSVDPLSMCRGRNH